MSPKKSSEQPADKQRRAFLAKLAGGALAAGAIAGPLKALNGSPEPELAPEADPGEDSIFAPRKPDPKQ